MTPIKAVYNGIQDGPHIEPQPRRNVRKEVKP